MKSVLKIRLLIVFLAVVCTASAQFTYRLEVGYTNPDRYGTNISHTYFNGLRVGGNVEYKLKNNISLLSGVLYSIVYSNKLQGYPDAMSVRYMSIGHFLDVPLRLAYTYPITDDLKVFGYAGPSLNIGLSQFQETTSTLNTSWTKYTGIKTTASYQYKESALNRLNLQVGVGGGVQWKKYQIKSGYDWGINNLNRLDTGKFRQRGWYVSFSYDF